MIPGVRGGGEQDGKGCEVGRIRDKGSRSKYTMWSWRELVKWTRRQDNIVREDGCLCKHWSALIWGAKGSAWEGRRVRRGDRERVTVSERNSRWERRKLRCIRYFMGQQNEMVEEYLSNNKKLLMCMNNKTALPKHLICFHQKLSTLSKLQWAVKAEKIIVLVFYFWRYEYVIVWKGYKYYVHIWCMNGLNQEM